MHLALGEPHPQEKIKEIAFIFLKWRLKLPKELMLKWKAFIFVLVEKDGMLKKKMGVCVSIYIFHWSSIGPTNYTEWKYLHNVDIHAHF